MLIQNFEALFVQAQQSAACNASHTIRCRLSRWLLRVRDLTDSDMFPMTQELLAQMLGVRRMSVSSAAKRLQHDGLIRCQHRKIEITDLDGLIRSSCECYGKIKGHYDKLLHNIIIRN